MTAELTPIQVGEWFIYNTNWKWSENKCIKASIKFSLNNNKLNDFISPHIILWNLDHLIVVNEDNNISLSHNDLNKLLCLWIGDDSKILYEIKDKNIIFPLPINYISPHNIIIRNSISNNYRDMQKPENIFIALKFNNEVRFNEPPTLLLE